jgi:hypothetical protein
MMTNTSLSDTARTRDGYSILIPRLPASIVEGPSPPCSSNRSYRRLEINISPTKQRTEVLSNRPKSADPARLASGVRRGGIGVLRDQRESKDLSSVFWRQMMPPCRGDSESEERSLDSDSRPSKGNGKSRDARVSARDDKPGRQAKKRLIATVPNSKFESSPCKQALYRNSNRNKKSCFGFPFSPYSHSYPMQYLWNLKSCCPQRPCHRHSGATLRHKCQLLMTPGKTNSGVSTSKKAVRVVIVLEVYTPGRFLRRYL